MRAFRRGLALARWERQGGIMEPPNIYQLIEQIRQRPEMYVRDRSLSELSCYLHGYMACLAIHGIKDVNDGRLFDPREFNIWLYEERGWSGSAGLAYALEEQTASKAEAFDLFFELVEEFRNGT